MKLTTKETELKIPLTHMADIAYLLLIFIIIFSLISTTQTTPGSLPESSSAEKGEKAGYELNIMDQGYSFNGRTIESLSVLIDIMDRQDRNLPVKLMASKRKLFGGIKIVLEQLKEMGFVTVEFLVATE